MKDRGQIPSANFGVCKKFAWIYSKTETFKRKQVPLTLAIITESSPSWSFPTITPFLLQIVEDAENQIEYQRIAKSKKHRV